MVEKDIRYKRREKDTYMKLIQEIPEINIISKQLGYLSLRDFLRDVELIHGNASLENVLRTILISLGIEPHGTPRELLDILRGIIKKHIEFRKIISIFTLDS